MRANAQNQINWNKLNKKTLERRFMVLGFGLTKSLRVEKLFSIKKMNSFRSFMAIRTVSCNCLERFFFFFLCKSFKFGAKYSPFTVLRVLWFKQGAQNWLPDIALGGCSVDHCTTWSDVTTRPRRLSEAEHYLIWYAWVSVLYLKWIYFWNILNRDSFHMSHTHRWVLSDHEN